MPVDTTFKHILLFGAGKSATVLINYLKNIAKEKSWSVTVVDSDLSAVQQKVGEDVNMNAVSIDVLNSDARQQYIRQSNLVISLMPPQLHYLIAVDCLQYKKHLITSSYISPEMRETNLLKSNKPASVKTVANEGVKLLLHGKGKKIVGFQNRFNSILARILPDRVMMKIKMKLASAK